MIVLKTARELNIMREAGRISAGALRVAGMAVEPGVTTGEIDKLAYDYIISQGAKPNFLHYNGYPATACISINDEVIHGIPSKSRVIREGDIVSIDLGACFEGYNGDNAATFACGDVSDEAKRLMDATRESLYEGIRMAIHGNRIGDISNAIQQYVETRGYSVVRDFVGHGVGASLHEAPEVPNFGKPGRGTRLVAGMTLAIEPMINVGTPNVKQLSDGWTIKTADGKLSAHFEHSIAITPEGPVILTLPD
ncbi:MAG: type I methionyl aminopeptidase [Acutalibacteraceae bacterium]|nr:type I methionyl aminopeptidase [Clostridia bacterium]MBQ2420618.1 type I methionyl aminopeptidase [Clostridia bacterium]MEE1126880.1 type I methionyl aminopeptidase [Acutalibacteraceae bacterium]